MAYEYHLPSDKSQAETVVANIISEGKSKRNPQDVRWWVANYYLQGLREFSNIDYQNGTITVSYLNEAGILKFRHEGIVAKYVSQLGRLLSLDLSPAVRTKNISLDGLRKASTAQVVLDNAITEDKIKKFEMDFLPPFLMYGTVGVGLWVEGADSHGLEVIPPWEIFPIPINVSGPSEVRGLMRVRYVPVEWVKNLAITPSGGSKVYKGVDEVKLASGNIPAGLDSIGEGMTSLASSGGGFFIHSNPKDDTMGKSGSGKKKDEKMVPITGLVEVWTETSDGFLGEYRIYMGISKFKELHRRDLSLNKYYMPVQVIRDVPIGSFWGRSYIDQLIPLNVELEYALSSMFQAVSDFDLYGLQLWPSTLGTPPLAQRGQDGLKRIVYEPDYTSPDLKPENIEPAKMVAPQLKAIELASALMDKQANQPAQMMSGDAPGRVDSSAGLGFLYEVSGIPLAPSAKNIAIGMAGIYRALLRILKDTWSDQQVVNISNLDDSLAGIALDAESGTVSLSKNAIPFPEEVSITVASEVPISKEQQKAELKEAYKDQRITLDEFNWTVRKKGLDIPVGDEIGWQNYRRAMLNNILIFGDGETPNKNVISSPNDLFRVHLQVIQAFVARPEFFVASSAVRDAFNTYIEELKAKMGEYPEQLPYPDESAEMMMQPPQGMMPMGGGI